MKYFVFLICLIFSININSQVLNDFLPKPKYPELFKVVPLISVTDPEWVHLMYSENPNYFEISDSYKKHYNSNLFEKNVHTQNYKHLSNKISLNSYIEDDGSIYVPTVNEIENKEAFIQSKLSVPKSNQSNWSPIGPFETFEKETGEYRSSQLNVYTFDQSLSNPNVLYAGGETGPLFKSTDKGDNWFPLAEDLTLKAGGAIEINPSNENIVYVSDGANKLYKTIDGGASWTTLLNLNNLRITDISVDGQKILVAGTTGLRRSTDGGLTWSLIFSDKCWDIEQKMNDLNTYFVAKSNTSLNRTEIWKSIDGGLTFSPKTTGWFNPLTGVAASNGGARIGVSNADPNRVYVVLLGSENDANDDANYIGIYRSNDAGETWNTPYDGDNDGFPDNEPGGPYGPNHWCFSTFNPNDNGGYNQGFYNLALDVSDSDADKFLVGFLNLFKSEDGGETYTEWGGYRCDNCGSGYRHPDIQEIEINGNDVWVTSDGGIDYYNNDLDFQSSKIKGLSGVNFWEIDQGWNEDVIVGGRYHNGNTGYFQTYGLGKFLALGGGESPTGYVNKGINREVHFNDIQDVKLPATLLGGTGNTNNYQIYPNQHYYLDYKSEVINDPRYWNQLYIGKDNNMWKSEDGGLSFDLLKTFSGVSTDIVKGIEISRNNPDVIYTVQSFNGQGKLWKSIDAGNSWNELTIPTTNNGMLITVSESDENILYLSSRAGGNSSSKIFKTTDGGNTWTNETTSMLNGERIGFIKIQAGTDDGVYLATDYNVYYKNNSLSDWELFINGLPANRSPLKLMPFYRDSKLRYALFNRGVYESIFYDDFSPIAQPMVANKEQYCANRGVQFEDFSIIDHNGASWNWSFPGASSVSSNSVRNPLVFYSTTGLYDVSLTITDANGLTDTKTIQGMVEIFESQCAPEPTPQMALECATGSQFAESNNMSISNATEFTFTAWIKPNGIQNDYASIFSLGSGSGDNKNALNFRGGNNSLGFHWNGGHWGWNSGLTVPEDEWSFIAITVTDTLVTLFLNEQTATREISLNSYDISRILLGTYYTWSSRNYYGLLDEATFWTKALSVDEVRLSRHLSKQDMSDPDLFAYYQFNHNNFGSIYDKKNAYDLKLNQNPNLVSSTAPFGPGTSEIKNITSSGVNNFVVPEVSLDFGTGTIPDGNVVVTAIDINPSNLPDGIENNQKYWVVNNYGNNQTFDYLNNIKIGNAGNLNGSDTTTYYLHKRNSNSDNQLEWELIDSSRTVDNNINEITFENNQLTSFSQFFITKTTFADTTTTQDSSFVAINSVENLNNIYAYPNPIVDGRELTIEAGNESFKFTLFDISGKEIQKKIILSQEKIQIQNLASGIYFYVIETKSKLYSNKIIVK